MATESKCDDACQNTLQMHVASYLTAALGRRAKVLRRSGASSLLIDLTDNGGGTDWTYAAVREISPLPLRDPAYAFVRSPHWAHILQSDLTLVRDDLAHHREPSELLEETRERLEHAIAESRVTCDRNSVWTQGSFHCSQLVRGLLYVSGILPYAKPDSYPDLASRTVLFKPLAFSYAESVNRLPLYVVVNSNTYSAAEYFAAVLQNNRAATILGEVTGGAGCG
ncbi:MAG: S41 family peptidase [Steroidobacteraceae bacterium]